MEEREPDAPALAVVFSAVLLAGLAVRVWQFAGKRPLWWGDSLDYLTTSQAPLLSLDLWAGERPVAVPLLLKLVDGHDAGFVWLQAIIAALCWAALAASVATVVRPTWPRWCAAAAVLAMSTAFPVAMWERSVLSEPLAMASLVLVVAAGVQLARGVTGGRVVAFLCALAVWLASRDSHTSVAVLLAVAFSALCVLGRPRFDRNRTALAVGVLLLAGLANLSASQGHRFAFPLRNVFAVRVLPFPERVDWFADHGMPQADRFAERPAARPGRPALRVVRLDDPTMQPWLDWIETDGRATFLEWLVTHPGYVLFEPWRDPERAFNNAEGHRSYYAPADMRAVPPGSSLLFPPRPVALLVAVTAAAWVVRRGRWRSPAFLVGVTTVLAAVPHALISWHSDGMETARHLAVPVVQLHIGVLLMTIAALAGTDRGHPRETCRRQPAAEDVDEQVATVRGAGS